MVVREERVPQGLEVERPAPGFDARDERGAREGVVEEHERQPAGAGHRQEGRGRARLARPELLGGPEEADQGEGRLEPHRRAARQPCQCRTLGLQRPEAEGEREADGGFGEQRAAVGEEGTAGADQQRCRERPWAGEPGSPAGEIGDHAGEPGEQAHRLDRPSLGFLGRGAQRRDQRRQERRERDRVGRHLDDAGARPELRLPQEKAGAIGGWTSDSPAPVVDLVPARGGAGLLVDEQGVVVEAGAACAGPCLGAAQADPLVVILQLEVVVAQDGVEHEQVVGFVAGDHPGLDGDHPAVGLPFAVPHDPEEPPEQCQGCGHAGARSGDSHVGQPSRRPPAARSTRRSNLVAGLRSFPPGAHLIA